MQIPKKLKIGGFDYAIIMKNRLNNDGVTTAGSHFQPSQTIWIDSECHQQQKEETLLHEIIEAISSANDLRLEHQNVSTLSTALYQVLQDNDLLK